MRLFLYVLLSLLVTIRANGCFEVERDALLTFKAGLHDPGNLMSSWQGPNCCNWSGVTCHAKTHHVVKLNLRTASNWVSHALSGELDPALVSLRHLTHLDLSNNDFSNHSIPKFIGSLQNLVYLNLSWSWFMGAIPYEVGNLSRLQFLDLSYSEFTGTIPPQLGNVSDLQYLNLFYSYRYIMPANNSLSWLYHLSNLRYIDMSGAAIDQIDWSEISKMHQLQTLIFSGCNLLNIPTDLFHVNLSSLEKLDLSRNSFSATLPNWLWNLTGLSYLDLSYSEFHGTIPSALAILALLNYLVLAGNNFNNVDLKPFSKLNNLRTIDLRSLGLGGDVQNLIKSLGSNWYNLEVVYLSDNKLSGNISTSWITQMRNLSSIDLSLNLLTGHITSEIGILTQLNELDLSYNSLSGVIIEVHFVNLSNLEYLDLSNNMLTIKINDKWVPPFQLRYLNMESCKVGPKFPNWLRGQTQLYSVLLSNTSIAGTIPTWFWNTPLSVVSLSFNNITGSLPTSFQMSRISTLYLNSNNISGTIPRIWGMLYALDLSENRLNGSIAHNLCETDLFILDLSNNAISGEIPVCLKNNSHLYHIDLSNNQITSVLPASVGSLQYLTILQLDNNKLYGEIPSTLQQCKSLVFLSLARNTFSGTIPSWIGKLQDLVVLQLRSNNFSACIPPELGNLDKLQVLDLAHNFLVGPIPSSVGNISGMKNATQSFDSTNILYGDIYYGVTLHIDINGQQAYASTPLDFNKTIDISGNNLNGKIPEEIWQLQAIINLNLSKNYLVGKIPQTVGDMLSLESLDLSFNELSGSIPQALSTLSLLHNLNLSYNNFSGKIPTGRQLDTINVPSIYVGNPDLCGPPTDKNCSQDQASTSIYYADDNNGKEMLWFYVVVVLGFIVGFWCLWGVLIFQNDWRVAYFRMVDRLFDKMYICI